METIHANVCELIGNTPLIRLNRFGGDSQAELIVEMEAFNPGVMGNTATQSTLHYGLPGAPFTGTSSQNDNMMPLDAGFHEYAVEWERDQMRYRSGQLLDRWTGKSARCRRLRRGGYQNFPAPGCAWY